MIIGRLRPDAFVLAFGMFLSGCGGLGPGFLGKDRIDYNVAISESWKEEMMLNLVKLRYGDAPVFLDVASIISQYQVQGSVNLNGSWFNAPSPVYPAQMIGGIGSYADRPTVTYSPMVGERFARSLMTPIPPGAVISLIQAGYPADLVLRLTVHSINGLENRYGGQERIKRGHPDFYRLIERMRSAQLSNAFGLRSQKINDKLSSLFIIRNTSKPEVSGVSREIRTLLKLNPQVDEMTVVYGSVRSNDHEVALLTRSVLDVLIELASYIEVPSQDVAEDRVNPTMPADRHQGMPMPPLIRIHCGLQKPEDAFISVPYHKNWFWIEDKDITSKRMLSFLMFLFTLVESPDKAQAPLLTIPTG